jgi:preprotein translocase subunit YajC
VLSVLTQSRILLAAEGGGGNIGSMAFMMLAIFGIFYLLFIRPQRKEQSTRQMMLESLKKNDRIVTVGGILGVITNVDRDKKEVTLKVDESSGAKLRMTLNSIARVVVDESSKQSSS